MKMLISGYILAIITAWLRLAFGYDTTLSLPFKNSQFLLMKLPYNAWTETTKASKNTRSNL